MNFNKIPSKERAFSEVYGGYYDEHGFYNSPNGSKVYNLKKVFGILMGITSTDMVLILMVKKD